MDALDNRNDARDSVESAAARRRLATLPGFSRERAEAARLTRLVGMTNRVWKVEVGGEALCLRIPGTGAAAMVDRRAEETNARLAAKVGVAPEVLYFGEDGVMLTRFVDDAAPLLPARAAEREGAIERAAIALRQLHDCGAEFAGTFQAFATIDSYVAVLGRLEQPLSDRDQNTVRGVQAIGRAQAARPALLKPCHCDPTGRNLLDTGERVWLVDWEYSGMNDPMWDLAYFSIESRFDETGERKLATAYFGRAPGVLELARISVLKPVCEVQAALWALIQAAEGNRGGDFSGYAKATFERAAERIRGGAFKGALELLQRAETK